MDRLHPTMHCPLCVWSGTLQEFPGHIKSHEFSKQVESREMPKQIGNHEISSEQHPPRKRRRLDTYKCSYCRNAKKKCVPVDGHEKCHWCLEYGEPCSELTTKTGIVKGRSTSDCRSLQRSI
ncbi:hypothetical protein BKA67DRAFT_322064 [Truncatella angustata]|uniref:Zn(2)-C6 fungal-type domain-containing protein n=1 Tax=Truncatella angustata TaxID=152316 RepID=A0A9P8ZWA3_9PEZI|nr:uncharacterized protein BKA67DRAFT_322064 [Truncatella angustata]KAH6653460.1 hypothetical protein BKA67DRAFT_322064 [Truncatella angustata]